jgi:hypothetical protein
MPRFLKSTATVCAIALATLASVPASAQHGYGGGPHVGFYVGVPLYAPYPYYYPPPYYGYPPVVYAPPAAPSVYVERGDVQAPPPSAQPSAPASSYWYYCADSKAYYPHVRECASPWQRVAPQPSSANN